MARSLHGFDSNGLSVFAANTFCLLNEICSSGIKNDDKEEERSPELLEMDHYYDTNDNFIKYGCEVIKHLQRVVYLMNERL